MHIKYVRPKWSPRSCLWKTVNSVQLMEWGLGRLADILGEYDYQAPDLLSCMTLGIENSPITVYSKKVNMSKLEYARSFGATMKEIVKLVTSWAVCYHTSQSSWYPKPDTMVSPHNVPLMMPLSGVNLPANDCDLTQLGLSIWCCGKTKDKAARNFNG